MYVCVLCDVCVKKEGLERKRDWREGLERKGLERRTGKKEGLGDWREGLERGTGERDWREGLERKRDWGTGERDWREGVPPPIIHTYVHTMHIPT